VIAGRIRRSAAEGALAWLAYAVVETAFTVLVPWIAIPAYEYRESNWAFSALLFVLYPAAGALFGAAFALISRGALADSGGTLGLLAVFAAYNLFGNGAGGWTHALVAMTAALAAAILISAVSPAWSRRLAFVRNPWAVALLVAGVPRIVLDLLTFATRKGRVEWALAYAALVLLASFAISRRPQAGLPRRAWIAAALAVATLLACLFPKAQPRIEARSSAGPAPAADRPNIILITLDTTRADHLSVYGYARRTTPNLERFASDAFLYEHAIAPADMTLPSHGSLFTGVYASRHGAHMSPDYPRGRPLESKYPTLAEVLRGKGYATSAIVANSGYLQQVFLFYRGFDYYDDRWPTPFLIRLQSSWLRTVVVDFLERAVPLGELNRVYRDAHAITNEAFQALETAHGSGRPLFLFLNYMDAHFPCVPPAPYNSMFPGRDPSFDVRHFRRMKTQVMSLKRPIRAEERNHLISQYDGGIAYMDAELARLFGRLKQLGMYDNSMIVVASDHGEAFGDRHLVEHGGVSVYEEEIRVPLIVKYPHSARRGSSGEAVSLVDVMPTALEAAGGGIPAGLDGVSLLAPPHAGDRLIIGETFASPEQIRWDPSFDRDERAIYSGRLKLIASTKGSRELYDLERDPGEARNLYAAEPGTAKPLEAALRQWVAVAARPQAIGVAPQLRLDALKSLGYVQ
jgi:arylsulfatase A-like enzyme